MKNLKNICLLKTVEKRDAATLGALIYEFIAEQATVYSDQWAAYVSFFSSGVNHSENFVNPQNPQIHTVHKRLRVYGPILKGS